LDVLITQDKVIKIYISVLLACIQSNHSIYFSFYMCVRNAWIWSLQINISYC